MLDDAGLLCKAAWCCVVLRRCCVCTACVLRVYCVCTACVLRGCCCCVGAALWGAVDAVGEKEGEDVFTYTRGLWMIQLSSEAAWYCVTHTSPHTLLAWVFSLNIPGQILA